MNNIISKVKEKKEFSGLPDSVVELVLKEFEKKNTDEKCLIKEVRNKLRKYFGIFLTNKVIRPKNILDYKQVLINHISSKKRDYNELYEFISNNCKKVKTIFDFGCGVNGFSYDVMKKSFGNIRYIGIEASKQIVDNSNIFFKKNNYNAECLWHDLFDLDFTVEKILEKNNIFFCFQIIDALDKLEKKFSYKFLLKIKEKMFKEDKIVLSFSVESISGKEKFKDNR
jgi:hypothetical protein